MSTVVIQASSRSWAGEQDLCLNKIDNKPVVSFTIDKFINFRNDVKIIVSAPSFDQGGILSDIVSSYGNPNISAVFCCDSSPLERMIEATRNLDGDECFLRVDALHFAVDCSVAFSMIQLAKSRRLDCLKYPDDYPAQLTSDVYRVDAIRRLNELGVDPIFHVHPKYAFFLREEFNAEYFEPPDVDDDYLYFSRQQARQIYVCPRLNVTEKSIEVGNQLTFHYELALDFLPSSSLVLDIACGNGYGSRILANHGFRVLGGDIDAEIIETAKKLSEGCENIEYRLLDVTNLDLADQSVEAIVSMETIEHVDDVTYLSEMHRVLSCGGILIISTPQNSLGHIPINAEHIREYGLDEIVGLISEYFEIVKVVGIKQGRVVVEGSEKGNNMMIVCKKQDSITPNPSERLAVSGDT